jgi:hypothetical protein
MSRRLQNHGGGLIGPFSSVDYSLDGMNDCRFWLSDLGLLFVKCLCNSFAPLVFSSSLGFLNVLTSIYRFGQPF